MNVLTIDKKQKIRQKAKTGNGNHNSGETIISGLNHYGIGDQYEDDFQAIQQSSDKSGIGLTDGTIYSIGKNDNSDPTVFIYSDEPEERNTYSIGHGEGKALPSDSLERTPICRDCYTMSDGSTCSVPQYECCSDDDCSESNTICSHRNCIVDEYFRFTLKWIGDDDYDLFVVTPDGAEISYENEYDPASMGTFQREPEKLGQGYHVENIYFPIKGGPSGVYRFYVRSYFTINEHDAWTVTVREAGHVVAYEWGVGTSESFFCKKDEPRPPITRHPTPFPTSRTPKPVESPNRPPLGQPTLVPVSTPQPTPSPAPQTICNANDECCVNSDCGNPLEICEQKSCIRIGNPRFTLKWFGLNTLNMFVITPDGVTLSPENKVDVQSSGVFELNTNDPSLVKNRIQNVYFPLEGAPGGIYEYGVRYNDELGKETAWMIESYDEDGLVDSRSGTGNSELFYYFHSTTDGPQRPIQPPPACSLGSEQCCIDSDCTGSVLDFCAQRTCISEGSLRITLEWTGNDDLDLFVTTPSMNTISNEADFDTVSGGRFQSSKESSFGFNIENIYFPSFGAPAGLYNIIVDASAVEGDGSDLWTLRIYEDGELKFEESRSGDFSLLSYEVSASNTDLCNPSCADDGSEVCVSGACIKEGNPRFTLRWGGESFYSLTVITPAGQQISEFAPFDAVSRGIFEGPTQQITEGNDVESVYFPIDGGPLGLYSFFITNSGGGITDEVWELSAHVNGQMVEMVRGSGNTDLLSFQFDGITPIEPDDPNEPDGPSTPDNPNTPDEPNDPNDPNDPDSPDDPDESQPQTCQSTSDCSLPNTMCIKKFCIQKGALQFVLSWNGDSDFDLSLGTPFNNIVSSERPLDAQTGGKFQSYDITDDSISNIETIYFTEGPTGRYAYFIKANEDNGDTWDLTILVDGEEIESFSGQGKSDLLFFDYAENVPMSMPTDAPVQEPGQIPTDQPVQEPGQVPNDEPVPEPSNAPVAQPPDVPVAEPPGVPVAEPPGVPVAEPPGSPGTQPGDSAPEPDVEVQGAPEISAQEPLTVPAQEPPSFPDQEPPDIVAEAPRDAPVQEPQDGWHSPVQEPTSIPVHKPPDIVAEAPRDAPVQEPQDIWHSPVQELTSIPVQEPREIPTEAPLKQRQAPRSIPVQKPPVRPPEPPRRPTQDNAEIKRLALKKQRQMPLNLQKYEDKCEHECCSNDHCPRAQICTGNTCVKKGSPQFVLSWEGTCDLALQVMTPANTTISWQDPVDFTSGGRFESHFDFINDLYIENIFFAPNDGLRGTYPYYVHSFAPYGVDDSWTVAIYIDGIKVRTDSGRGSSGMFFFRYTGDTPEADSTMKPTMMPVLNPTINPIVEPTANPVTTPDLSPIEDSCKPFVVVEDGSLVTTNGECCSDESCFPNESCTARTCVDEGNPRFTLSWFGSNDLDILVVTPLGTIISYSQPDDPLTGGKFGEDYDQFEYGLHVENIYFPTRRDETFSGYGEYSFYVRKGLASDTDNEWTVGVYVNGEKQLSVNGTGNSEALKYTLSPP